MSEGSGKSNAKSGKENAVKESELSKVYVFTAYYLKGDKQVGEMEPVVDTVVFADDPDKAKHEKYKPVVLRTNKNGLLYRISEKLEDPKDTSGESADKIASGSAGVNAGNGATDTQNADSKKIAIDFEKIPSYLETKGIFHTPTNKDRPIIVPPADAVSFMAASAQKGRSWMEDMVDMAKTTQTTAQPLALQDISFTQLRKPKKDDVGEEEVEYKRWYEGEKEKFQANPDRKLKGYVIPKIRAIIFAINKNLPVSERDNVQVSPPNGGALKEFRWKEVGVDSNNRFGIIQGSKYDLKEGLYRITVYLDKIRIDRNSSQWNSLIKKGDPKDPRKISYRLAEMASFSIVNSTGEFDIINCDPITVEETLITQFPRTYAHLLQAARSGAQQVSVKDNTAIGDKPITPAKGFMDYATNLSLLKEKSQMIAGLGIKDAGMGTTIHPGTFSRPAITPPPTGAPLHERMAYNYHQSGWERDRANHRARVDSYNDEINRQGQARKNLMIDILKSIHAELAPKEDKKVRAVLDSVIGYHNALGAYEDYSKARKALALAQTPGGEAVDNAITALVKKYYRMPPANADEVLEFGGSLAGRIGVPIGVSRMFTRTVAQADLANKAIALGMSAVNVYKSYPKYEKSIEDYCAVAKDYYDHLKEKTVKGSVSLTNYFELGKAILNEEAKSDLTRVATEILDRLEKDDTENVSVIGHTCDLGNFNTNITLSKERAEAVRVFLEGLDVDPNRIDSDGVGSVNHQVLNDSPFNRAKNRRVEITYYSVAKHAVCPSREGIGSMERYRSLTVQNSLNVDAKWLEMGMVAFDMAIGVMSVIPVTAPFALAIVLGQAGYGLAVNLGTAIEEIFATRYFSQTVTDFKREWRANRESRANQELLIKMLSKYKDPNDASVPREVYWGAQFRVRSEAVAGLMNLLMLAAKEAKDEHDTDKDALSYHQLLEKYRVAAYIENFLLNDEWLYPVHGTNILKMDSYWIYAVKEAYRANSSDDDAEQQRAFGLDSNARLLSTEKRKELSNIAGEKLRNAEPYLPPSATAGVPGHAYTGFTIGNGPTLKKPPHHIHTDYQGYFPIHHLGTESIYDLGETFNPSFNNMSVSNYAYTAIYYRDILAEDKDAKKQEAKRQEWIPFNDDRSRIKKTQRYYNHGSNGVPLEFTSYIYKEITPYTPIRVLVVFDEHTLGFLPLKFTLHRIDGMDVEGPEYKELAKPLTEEDLFENEQQWVGRVGCVFYPFFQVWDKTFLGIKPVAGAVRLSAFPSVALYHLLGNLNEMEYQISCQVANTHDTKLIIPFEGKETSSGNFNASATSNTIRMDIEPKLDGRHPESALMSKSFLASRSNQFHYPPLYDGIKSVRPMIKIGEESPFIMAGLEDNEPIYKKELAAMEKLVREKTRSETSSKVTKEPFSVEVNKSQVNIKGFDWNTPVEFAFVATCTRLDKKDYEDNKLDSSKESKNYDWRALGCDVTLFEDATLFEGSDTQGPTMNSKLIYLGKASRKRSASFNAEGVLDWGYTFDETNSAHEKDPRLKQIRDILTTGGPQAMNLIDWEGGSSGGTFTRYVFATIFVCKYESPKGVKINSIRPFGRQVFAKTGDHDDELRYIFKKFDSAGTSGMTVASVDYTGSMWYGFNFSAPVSFTQHAPWCQTKSEKDIKAMEASLKKEELEKIRNATMEDKDLRNWLEKDAAALKNVTVKSMG